MASRKLLNSANVQIWERRRKDGTSFSRKLTSGPKNKTLCMLSKWMGAYM